MKLDRATAIRQHLFAQGHSSIADIAEVVGASEPTVRRDLAMLEADGAIVRTHGGARIAESVTAEVLFESREQIGLKQKRLIGEAAYERLLPGAAVFLDAGTTVLQLARLIRLKPMPLRVFTNCLPVAQHLMGTPDVTVTLLGGTLRPQNASLVGPIAEAALSALWFDQLFLGAGAIGPDGAVSSADEQEARINSVMVQRTAAPVILADASKFGARLTYRVVQLAAGMEIITDSDLAPEWRGHIADIGLRLTVAGPQ